MQMIKRFLQILSIQAESLLHSLEQETGDIGLYMNANVTEYACYNLEGAIFTQNDVPLKLVDEFTYLSSVSSTESDVNIRQAKMWTAFNRLSIIWKSYLSDKIKQDIFEEVVVSVLLYGSTTWTLTKRIEKKFDGKCTWMLRVILNKSRKQHPTKQQYGYHLSSRKHPRKTNKTCGTM